MYIIIYQSYFLFKRRLLFLSLYPVSEEGCNILEVARRPVRVLQHCKLRTRIQGIKEKVRIYPHLLTEKGDNYDEKAEKNKKIYSFSLQVNCRPCTAWPILHLYACLVFCGMDRQTHVVSLG